MRCMKTEARFQFDTVLDTKSTTITEDANGDLIIEGFASDYGQDRDEEAFEPGALDDGLKSYMETNPVLLYNHRFGPGNALMLGQVLEVDNGRINPATGKPGLHFKARVDNAEPGTEARDIYNKVKRGTLRGVSIGGKFYRRWLDGARKIHKADVFEFSLTPVPSNPRGLAAVATKAFGEDQDGPEIDYDAINDALDSFGRGLDVLSR